MLLMYENYSSPGREVPKSPLARITVIPHKHNFRTVLGRGDRWPGYFLGRSTGIVRKCYKLPEVAPKQAEFSIFCTKVQFKIVLRGLGLTVFYKLADARRYCLSQLKLGGVFKTSLNKGLCGKAKAYEEAEARGVFFRCHGNLPCFTADQVFVWAPNSDIWF